VWVNDASAYRPIGAHSHRPMVTIDVFELLRVICRKSPIVIFNISIARIRMVTGQLADTPTRGLPTRGLDISRMPLVTLRA